jgi:hypothetical protein
MSRLFLPPWLNRGAAAPAGRRCRSRPTRPTLEALEGRCLPSTVTNLDDAGPGSLRQAILDTPAGGTVDFQPGLSGTITLTSGELAIGKDLTIDGPGASVITVSGNHASRVFDIAASITVAISGLTIADGLATGDDGSGIRNQGTLVLTDSTLTGSSSAAFGGRIANLAGSMTVTDSTITGNTATAMGGGIYNGGVGTTLTVINSIVTGNSAAYTTSAAR